MPRRPLRIVHVSRGLDVGGQEKLLIEFARGIDRRRFALHFVSLTGAGRLAPLLQEHGWPVTALEQPEGLRPALIGKLVRVFQQSEADVVHTHDDKPLVYASLAVKLAGVPRFVHTHHHGPVPYIGRRQILLLRAAALLTDAFVCVSRDSARYMMGQGLRRLRVLHNGIDLGRFAFHGPDVAGPALCVARLSAEKDIANLLRAVAALLPEVPDFRLDIAGDGPLRQDLEHLAGELKVSGAARFLGEVQDVPGLLARARLFVLPSQTEGISLTILEAMASGLPVVTTRVGGNPEIVVDGQTGLLVPAQDPVALAQALRKVWQNATVGRTFGETGRRRVEKEFDIRVMIRRYEDLYLC